MTSEDRAFIIELYMEYAERVYAYAWTLTKDADHANDLLQTAFLEACNKAEKREPVANWRAWLYGVVRNTYRNDHKLQKRELPLDELQSVSMPDDLGDLTILPRDLPESCREIIHLRVIEQLDYDVIAKKLNISPAVARQRFSRAIKECRKLMQYSE